MRRSPAPSSPNARRAIPVSERIIAKLFASQNSSRVDNGVRRFLSFAAHIEAGIFLRMNAYAKRAAMPPAAKRNHMSYAVASWRCQVRVINLIALVVCAIAFAGCRSTPEDESVLPRSLRDVPAQRLAYRFDADTAQPPKLSADDANAKLPAVQADFDARRKDDALLRTVVSPDGQRALALYATGQDEPGEFRIDMYAADGKFLRNLTPPELSGEFAPSVAWSPDGTLIAFIGRRSIASERQPAPSEITPDAPLPTDTAPQANASVAPFFAPVAVFKTEQVYVCTRDGFDLKPLTTREGLIYFHLSWAPDAHAIAALACKENEWDAREKENRTPAGRPRLITLDGRERLLDDELTDVLLVWSPDASKVATAFETDVAIYDAATDAPTGARLPLREPLLVASAAYDEKNAKNKPAKVSGKTSEPPAANTANANATPSNRPPISFNPVVRLEWLQPETLFVETGFVRVYANGPFNSSMRWHTLHLKPQAAQLH
ncbi:MAG: hypothetical protein ABR577_16350 [Pyrinomonadaceae bacterium]